MVGSSVGVFMFAFVFVFVWDRMVDGGMMAVTKEGRLLMDFIRILIWNGTVCCFSAAQFGPYILLAVSG